MTAESRIIVPESKILTLPTSRIITTGYQPHEYQVEIHRRLKRFSVLVCHRRFGKTVLAINELVDKGLRSPRSDSRFGYVAPYLKQAKSVTWDYLKVFTQNIPGCHYNESELSIRFLHGPTIRLFGADNADAMRGAYFDGVVMDEVADMKPFVWGEVVRPMLADRKGWALFIGTPKGVNLFFELYQRALTNPEWYAGFYSILETDGALVDMAEIEQARGEMSDAQFRQEFLCDFQAASDNILVKMDDIITSCGKHYHHREYNFAPKILGVDVARFGDDRSVILKRQGLFAQEPTVFQDIDNMQLAGHVAQQIDTWQPDAVFIDGGRGEGVIDRLRQLGYDVVEVQFGGKALNPRYTNKRSEMWGEMNEWIKGGGAMPNNMELKNDLATVTYSFDAANRLKLISKDELKKQGIASPDVADALALTFAYPVAQQTRGAGAGTPQFVTHHEYNPWE